MRSLRLYETQRAMRARRAAALRRGVLAVLDIGTAKVACLILRFVTETADPPAPGTRPPVQGAFRVIGAWTTRSRGVRFGEIAAMDETERAVRTALQHAQKMADVRVDHAIVCFSGGRPRSYGVAGETEVTDGAVTEADIGAVLAACDLPDYGVEAEALHALPVNYTLDRRSGLTNPLGQVGRHLAVDMHLTTVSAPALHNLLQCVRRCDLDLAGVMISSYAAGLAALTEDEQELGAACVDIGGGTTGLSIFVKRQMIYADTVRLGGHHVTGDICHGLQVSMQDAERLKTKFGGLIATGMDDRDMIELPSILGDWEQDRRQISRTELIGVMRPRVEEILEAVRGQLDAAGFECLPSQRIVLTGGTAQTPGLEAVAERVLGRRCRVGRPIRVHGLPQAQTGPAFAAAVGLALHASDPRDECWDYEMPLDRRTGRRMRQAIRWFRENW